MKRKQHAGLLSNNSEEKEPEAGKDGRVRRKSGVNSGAGKKERLPLKLKLGMSHILTAAIPILLAVTIITAQASSSLLNKVNESNLAYARQVTQMLDSSIAGIENLVTIISYNSNLNTTVGKNPSDYERPYEMLIERKDNFDNVILSLQSSNSYIENIFLVKENEIIGTAPDDGQLDFVNSWIEDYHAGDTKDRKISWYYNSDYLYAMKDINSFQTGKYIGVLVLQVDKGLFLDNIYQSFGSEARAALLDPDGGVILTPQGQEELGELAYFNNLKEQIGKNVKAGETSAGAFTTREGVLSETSVLYGSCSNQWIYMLQIPVNLILGDIDRLRGISALLVAGTLVLAAFIGIWAARSISGPIEHIRGRLKRMEQGDLTVRSEITGKYEIGQLSGSFNHMAENMKGLLLEVEAAAGKVESDSGELRKIAENSADASSEIVQAVEAITVGAEEQAKESEEAATVVKELVELFHTAENHFSEVVKATDSTREAGNRAARTMENLTAATHDANELTRGIRLGITQLGEKIHEISGIIEIINNISSQTNLLALNASIEAARAGDAGKGFAVVAAEINKLAAQSSDSVRSIASIIGRISDEMTQTGKMIEEGSGIYLRQGGAVSDTEVIFGDVVHNMDTISGKVASVYGIMEQIDRVKDKASDAITGIAAIAEEAAAATEEVLARGEEQTVTAEQLKNMALELGDVIALMKGQVGKFVI